MNRVLDVLDGWGNLRKMEVKEFVKTILKEVNEAVAESNNEKFSCRLGSTSNDYIEFDLIVASKIESSGKIGAEVLGIGGNAKGSTFNEAVNRIKLKVFAYKKSN